MTGQAQEMHASVAPKTRADSDADPYAHYRQWKGWNGLFAFDPDDADAFASDCDDLIFRGAEVLEIGFGSGRFLAWAQGEGARVSGVERIPELVAQARERGIEILPTDLESAVSLHRERFDAIFAFDVFEHLMLDEIARALAAAEQLTKPGGHLLLRFPNAQSPFGLAPQFGDSTHRSMLSRGVIEQLILGSSWSVARYRAAAMPRGRTFAKRVVRMFRRMAQSVMTRVLSAIYAQDIPFEPVVVLVLRRSAEGRR